MKIVFENRNKESHERSYIDVLKEKTEEDMLPFDWFVVYLIVYVLPITTGLALITIPMISFFLFVTGHTSGESFTNSVAFGIICLFVLVADLSIGRYIGDK